MKTFTATPRMRKMKQRFRSRLNLQAPRGVLGNDDETRYESLEEPGLYYVREFQAGGTLGAAKLLPMEENANMPLKIGQPVILGWDERNEWVIRKTDRRALAATGTHPGVTNPNNPQLQFIPQQRIITGLCTPNNPNDTTVVVNAWYFKDPDGIFRPFLGKIEDLNGYIPAAGEHCLACLFVLKDGSDVEVIASTPKPTLSGLDFTDIQECYDGSAEGSHPNWAWRLYGGQTQITANDSFLDLRNFINTDDNPHWQQAVVQTADNTPTALVTLALTEGRALTLDAALHGAQDSLAAACGGRLTATIVRATGGDVTLIGVDVTAYGLAGDLDFTVDVDVPTQTARLMVTGNTGEVWNWKTSRLATLS